MAIDSECLVERKRNAVGDFTKAVAPAEGTDSDARQRCSGRYEVLVGGYAGTGLAEYWYGVGLFMRLDILSGCLLLTQGWESWGFRLIHLPWLLIMYASRHISHTPRPSLDLNACAFKPPASSVSHFTQPSIAAARMLFVPPPSSSAPGS